MRGHDEKKKRRIIIFSTISCEKEKKVYIRDARIHFIGKYKRDLK